MKTIDQIINVKGTGFVGFDTETQVKLTGGKKNPLQGRVTKRTTGLTGMIFSDKESNGYENQVNRELAKLGITDTFKAGSSRWGHHIPGTPFIEHKDNMYLQVILTGKSKQTKYYVDGIETPVDEIQGLPKRQPIKNNVNCKRFKFDSITCLRYNRKEYTFYSEKVVR